MATQRSSTIVKSFELLALFERRATLTVGQCAVLTGAPRSSIHRLLLSLELVGALERTDEGHFQLGLRLLKMGSLTPVRRQYDGAARKPLQRLCAETGLPVHLAARDGRQAVLLEALPGTQLEMPTRVGMTIPLHSTASGKVLLAHAPPDVVDDVLGVTLVGFTRYTIREAHRLRAELAEIRASGIAVGNEETHYGVVCIAAPIHDRTGAVRTALSLTYPAAPRKEFHRYRRSLILARNDVEAQLVRSDRSRQGEDLAPASDMPGGEVRVLDSKTSPRQALKALPSSPELVAVNTPVPGDATLRAS
jgi:DNA-binding IclR family transcriptional regulator